jgi:uncharacterized protein (TIGR02266 family)
MADPIAAPPGPRSYPRADINLAVVCRGVGGAIEDFARKIGAGGMFIETETLEPVGTRVDLQFKLPGMPGPVEVTGRVAWTRPIGSEQPGGMGIAFDGIDPATRARIEGLVKNHQASV